jgi:hypothetical protein
MAVADDGGGEVLTMLSLIDECRDRRLMALLGERVWWN